MESGRRRRELRAGGCSVVGHGEASGRRRLCPGKEVGKNKGLSLVGCGKLMGLF
jgi:hypothetical protein